MTINSELEQLALLAGIDDLTQQIRRWLDAPPDWEPARRSRILVSQVLDRVRKVRIRLEAPLIVATFGGTGTGKSTLVNALIGQEVTASGRERPTTKTPILLVHSSLDTASLTGFDLSQFQIRVLDAPVLKDIVVIDCPDPDTSEGAATGSNLALLRSILPLCDVLIYTSTQQKYRSARVTEELADIASGCRLVFVQTHAETDSDIRDDWRKALLARWQVPELFFVDSREALKLQQQGQEPGGDFRRLRSLLTGQLGASRRMAVRRANLIDLLDESLQNCSQEYAAAMPALDQLTEALEQQRQKLQQTLTVQLRSELLVNSHLWERRLLSAVTDMWWFSPFSAVLRFYNGMGAFVASFTAFRARTSAQVALIGAVQGTRWLKARAEEREAAENLDRLAAFGISDEQLQEARMMISGHVQTAGIEDPEFEKNRRDIRVLRSQAANLEGEFLLDARREVDSLTESLARQYCTLPVRIRFEVLLGAYLLFVLGRIGHNFFWASFLKPMLFSSAEPAPLLSIDFYVPAILFLLLWSGILVGAFTWQLRRGLTERVEQLAAATARRHLVNGLFPSIEQATDRIRTDHQRMQKLRDQVSGFRRRLADSTSFLGGRR
ncbi:MAG: GTPase [Planctomyces sp.]